MPRNGPRTPPPRRPTRDFPHGGQPVTSSRGRPVTPSRGQPVIGLLAAPPDDRRALRELRRVGFADPAAALRNLHAVTPTPREAELLAPALPRLLAELGAAPDPDMALNNLERLAGQGEHAGFLRLVTAHPGAIPLLARLGGTSQFLADTLRRYPTLLPWLLEARTMRQWLADELAADLAASLAAFDRPEARWNVLRRFKYRQLLRIGCRDILGDADLTVTTEELSHMADVCLTAAWDWARERLERLYGAPMGANGTPTGLAVIGMGKLGGLELNYSSDIDPIFVYGEDGETAGGESGRIANGEFFAQAVRGIRETLESVTEEGHVFRVDLRLRPEGRSGALILSVDGYRRYFADRAEPWERQALIKARACAGDPAVAARFFEAVRPFVYRPGLDPAIVGHVRGMKAQIDRSLRGKDAGRRNVKLGRGGIREVEFLVQALQLLYGGDDPWLRERNSLRAIFRLAERGYLPPALGRELGLALVYLRTVEHRLQIVHEFQTHTLPEEPAALGLLARRMGIALPPAAAARRFVAEHRRVTTLVHRAFRGFFAAPPAAAAAPVRIPSYTALKATGFADPDRARQNLRRVLEGRPLVPYPAAAGRAIARLFPMLLDALWQSPDPDEALGQFERFVSAAGPRTAYLDLLADRPELLANLVRLCARGELLTELLVSQPELLNGLASPETFAAHKGERQFRAELAPAAQAGPGAGHHLADAAGSDRRRALLARDDRPGRGRAGGGVDARPRRDRGRMGRAPRRARAPGSRHHRRPRQARRPRADHRLRSRSLRGLRRRGRHRRGRVGRGPRLLRSRGGGAERSARRHHRRRGRVRGGSAPAPRLEGQRLRLRRRGARALLSRVGRPVGAPDAHARPAGGGRPAPRPRGAAPHPRPALRAGGPAPRPQGDARPPRADGARAGQGDARALPGEVRAGRPRRRGVHHPGPADAARGPAPWPPSAGSRRPGSCRAPTAIS